MMDTLTQVERLIELAIIQRSELRRLVEELPQLKAHLSEEIERTFEETEPQLRAELEEWTTKQTADKTAALGVALEAKIADLAKSLEVSTQARYNAIIAEREENARLAAQAEAKIAEHAASLPGAVKEIVSAELARFPRAGEIDQLRKEFAEPKSLNPRGKWVAGETYNKLDLVTINGDSYVSNIDGNTEKPSRSAGNWTLNAARGNSGGGGGITALNDLLGNPSAGDIVGSEGNNYVRKTLTAGTGITITDDPSTITIDASGAQEMLTATVKNAESVAITRGQVVYLFSATGGFPSVKLAYNTSDATSAKTFGVVSDVSIAPNGTGTITCVGVVSNLNLGAYNDGDTVYLGATPGSFTATKPYAPNHLVYVGIIERANAGNGELYVRIQNGYELDEIHDVQINNPRQAGQTLIYDATNALWKNARLTAGVGVSILNADSSITISADGGVNYQGTWNASTNTPTLTSSVGTKGFYYVVSVAGSTNLNGVTDWKVGDWAIFNGTAWEKVDTTDQVSSVFGRTGAVVGVSTDYSSVGITNTAIGASNPSTGAFTTLSATGNLTVSGTSTISNGTAAAPSLVFAGSTTTGLYRYGANVVGMAMNGLHGFAFNGAGEMYGPGVNGYVSLPSAGGVLLTASGTNQNITLTPSGTGSVLAHDTNAFYRNTNSGSDTATKLKVKTASNAFLTIDGGAATSGVSFGIYNSSSNPVRQSAIVGIASNTTAGSEAGYLSFFTQTGGSSLTERGRFTETGNFGLGTTSPDSYAARVLQINDTSGSTSASIKLTNNTTGATKDDGFDLTVSGSNALLIQRENAYIGFYTNATETMRLFANGNLFIGASPVDGGQKLQVSGNLGIGTNQWHFSLQDAKERLFYASNSTTVYRGWGSGVNHEFRTSGDNMILQMDNSQNATFAGTGRFNGAAAGAVLNLKETAGVPTALNLTNRNSTQTWSVAVDGASVDDKLLAFIESGSVRWSLAATTGNATLGGNLTVSGTGTSYIEAARSSIIGGSPRFQIESSSAPYYTSSIALIGNTNSSGNEAVVMFSKSRGTTNGSVTAVQSGDTIGGLYWTGADGTSLNTNAAAFLTQVDGAVSTGSVPLRYIWQIAASEKMRLNSSGNLLLKSDGIDSGNGKLQLATHTTSAGGIGLGPSTSFFADGSGGARLSGASLNYLAAGLTVLNTQADATYGAFFGLTGTSYSSGSISGVNSMVQAAFNTKLVLGTNASQSILLYTNNTTALTLDSSQNATFAGTVSLSTTTDKAGLTVNFPAAVTGSNGPAMTFKSWTNSANLINSGRVAFTITDGSASYGSKLELSVASSGSLTTAFTILQDLSSTAAGTLVANKSTTAFRIPNAETPASASATGSVGTITWDASYIYVCTAANTWKRVAIATWP